MPLSGSNTTSRTRSSLWKTSTERWQTIPSHSTSPVPLSGGRHPYYGADGYGDDRTQYDSWPEFISHGFYDSDPDMNLVYRWDWLQSQPTCPRCNGNGIVGGEDCSRCKGYGSIEGVAPQDYLHVFWVMQRKSRLLSTTIRVRPEDEPSIREWLAERAKTIAAIWHPIPLTLDESFLRPEGEED